MRTVSIRQLSGELITRAADEGELLGITNAGTLTGVLLPTTEAAVKRMVQRHHGDILRAIEAGGEELSGTTPPSTLADALAEEASTTGRRPFSRVPIRQVSGARIDRAARAGEILAVTNGRIVVALLIPVSAEWTQRLVERNLTSILRDVDKGEEELAAGEITDLDELLEPDRELVIGIKIVPDASGETGRVVGLLTDDLARPVTPATTIDLPVIDEGVVIDHIAQLVRHFSTSLATGKKETIAGVGIEIGGHVHHNRVVFSPNAQWDNLALADLLRARLSLPVVLENDANALAIRERGMRGGIDDDTYAVILLTEAGVGCGLVVNGELIRGVHGMAGEIGHVPVEFDRREKIVCRCTNPGCLEGAATIVAITAALADHDPSTTYEQALSILEQNEDDPIRAIFDAAGAALGRAISTILNLLNPSTVVIYGPTSLLGKPAEYRTASPPPESGAPRVYLEAMLRAAQAHTFSTGSRDCRFLIRRSTYEEGAMAAAAAFIHSTPRAADASCVGVGDAGDLHRSAETSARSGRPGQ